MAASEHLQARSVHRLTFERPTHPFPCTYRKYMCIDGGLQCLHARRVCYEGLTSSKLNFQLFTLPLHGWQQREALFSNECREVLSEDRDV